MRPRGAAAWFPGNRSQGAASARRSCRRSPRRGGSLRPATGRLGSCARHERAFLVSVERRAPAARSADGHAEARAFVKVRNGAWIAARSTEPFLWADASKRSVSRPRCTGRARHRTARWPGAYCLRPRRVGGPTSLPHEGGGARGDRLRVRRRVPRPSAGHPSSSHENPADHEGTTTGGAVVAWRPRVHGTGVIPVRHTRMLPLSSSGDPTPSGWCAGSATRRELQADPEARNPPVRAGFGHPKADR